MQKVAAGEFLISCVAYYHNAMPLIDEGAPLVFLFPDPYTSDIATEMHVLSWSKTPIATQLFALWLATKAQPLIEKLTYRGFPWVPGTKKYSMTKGKTMASAPPIAPPKPSNTTRNTPKSSACRARGRKRGRSKK